MAVFADEQVRLLLGVGNTTAPYDADDVRIAQAVADDVWLMTTRLREHSRDRATINLLNDHRAALRVSTWE